MNELNYRGKYKWYYYTNKEIKDKHPDEDFLTIGEVSNKRGRYRNMPLYNEDQKVLFVQPLNTYKKSIYKTVGYIWVEEKQGYVVVKKKNGLLLFSYCSILVLLITGCIFGINKLMDQPNTDPNAKTFEGNVKRPEDLDDTRIMLPGYDDWKMLAGTDEIYIALQNMEDNPCYFKFTIVLDETGEVLFKTGLIPPGKAITTVKLPKPFSKGIYPITITIDSYSLADEDIKLNGGEVKTNIVALEE